MSQAAVPPDLSRAVEALQARRYHHAVEFASKARRAHPNDPRVLATLGQAMSRAGKAKAALPVLKKALRADPENQVYRFYLAYALDEAAETEPALRELQTILDTDPHYDRAVQLRCAILRRVGRGREAWDWLAPMLTELPQTPAVALTAASLIPKSAAPEPVIERLRTSIADPATDGHSRRSLFYALGRLLDRTDQLDAAFAAFQSASRLLPEPDPRHNHAVLGRVDAELLARIEPAEVDGSAVVLICGMPRSGTTLTEQILAAHPQAATVGESPELGNVTRAVLQHADEHGVVPAELTAKFAKQYLKHLQADAQPDGRKAVRLIDKMPANIMHLGVAARMLPGLRVIRCLRDPRDIALSCMMQDFNVGHGYRRSLETLADEVLLVDEVADRWERETDLAIYESVLETLTADPEPNARALVDFAGLPWDDACLRFHESGSHVKTASVDQVRSGINTAGHGRWRRYENHLGPLLERLQPAIENWESKR